MNNSFFVNENQLQDWVTASEGIRDQFGIEKALGYVIGEKFYGLLRVVASYQDCIETIEEERRKPNYNPIRKYSLGKYGESVENRDETYEKNKKLVLESKDIIEDFTRLIETTFARHEINAYFDSHPRLGSTGHIASEEEHAFMVEKGMVERSVDTEVRDALVFDEMKKYFNR
ncbi:MAG: hypothetical protein HQL12_02930 [Candidatus Omnitrophica bacterium]|nr:hypothetical protein [Candidatus Omnitrophota bacterium]